MSFFAFFKVQRKIRVIGLTSIVVFTALLGANAANKNTDLKVDASYADQYATDTEMKFFDAFQAMSDEEFLTAITNWKEEFTYTVAGGLKAKNPFCERFIDQNAKYGVYGKIIAEYLHAKFSQNQSTPMLADDLVGMEEKPGVCPNWRKFDIEQRIRFWTWTFAAMASVESSCGAHKIAMTGVNGVPVRDKSGNILRYKIAIGLLQMEKAKSDRSWRGNPTCSVSESEIAGSYYNLRCGIDIMEDLVAGKSPTRDPAPIYRGPGMKKTSYWQHLNSENGGSIGSLMRSFSPCSDPGYLLKKMPEKYDPGLMGPYLPNLKPFVNPIPWSMPPSLVKIPAQ